VSETFTHMFLFQSVRNFKKWPRQPNRSMMAEYTADGMSVVVSVVQVVY